MALGEASVEIIPDLSGFMAKLQSGVVDAMNKVERVAESAGESIQDSFREAARQSEDALDAIGRGDPFSSVERDAESAGESIERSFREAARQSETAVSGIGGKVAGAFAMIGGAIAAAGLGVFLKDSITGASDLGESINAVNVTFGEAAAGITALAEGASSAIGLTQTDFNALSVRFSSFANSIAGPGGDVVSVIDDMTTRAADFASVMNLEVAEAAEVFQSGLAGETEPLKRYGIDLSAAAVENYALANGIASSASEMTEAQKVQARYGLLMESTSKTQGDFANTSDSLANGMRILKAEFGELQASLGAAMLPALQGVVGAMNKLVPALEKPMKKVGKALGDAMGSVVDAIGPVLPVLADAFATVLTNFATVVEALAPALKPLAKILATVAEVVSGVLASAFEAMAPVILAFVDAISVVVETVGPIILDIFRELAPVIQQVAAALSGQLAAILPIIVDLIQKMAPIFGEIIGVLVELASTVLSTLIPPLSDLLTTVLAALAPVLPEIADAFLQIVEALMPLIPPLLEIVVALLPPLTDLLVALIPLIGQMAEIFAAGLAAAIRVVTPIIEKLAAAITKVVEWIGKLITWVAQAITAFTNWLANWRQTLDMIGRALSDMLPKVLTWFRELPGKIISSLGNLAQTLWGKAKELIGGFLTAIENAWQAVKTWLSNVAQKVLSAIGNLTNTLRDKGRDVIIGLWNGMKVIWETVTGWLGSFGERILRGLGNIGSILLQIGRDIINGLWNGMKEVWNRLTGWLGSIAGGIAGAFKSVLNIGSPSRVMRDVGRDTMKGLELGLDDGISGIRGVLKSATSEITKFGASLTSIPMPGLGGVAIPDSLSEDQITAIFDDLEVAERKLTLGNISMADYEQLLIAAISKFEVYSDEYMRIYSMLEQAQRDIFQNQQEIAAAEIEHIRNRYEMTGRGAATYLAMLKQQQSEYAKFSSEWTRLQQEINSLRGASVSAMYEEAEAAREAADAVEAQAEARREYLKVVDPSAEAKEDEKRRAGMSYADSIYQTLQAKAAMKGIPDRSVRWAKFMRKRLEKARATMNKQGFTHVADGLSRILIGIPDMDSIDNDESDGTKTASNSQPVSTASTPSVSSPPPSLLPAATATSSTPANTSGITQSAVGLITVPAVNIQSAIFQDATDAELVAQKVSAALSLRSIS